MGENSKIEWTDHTFNPWVGCTKVSPACDSCYAESWAKRTGQAHLWQGERRRTSASNWRQPIKWNRDATAAGVRRRVFCASLADVFDNKVSEAWRADLWGLIDETPALDWLLLTKRPQNAAKMIMAARRALMGAPLMEERHVSWPWPNVWVGTTVENEEEAVRRLPHLIKIPAVVRFVSYEPALGPVDWSPWIEHLHWIIAGGESGPHARPADPRWFRETLYQCQLAGIPFFFKQWGEWSSPGYKQPGAKDFFWPLADGSGPISYRVGKKAAGRRLDGTEHNAFPSVHAALRARGEGNL